MIGTAAATYTGHLPYGEARSVAALFVATMRDVVGVEDPASLVLTTG